MSVTDPIFTGRELGQIEVSIGTSLALEGAFGIYPDMEVSTPPLLNYNELWINISTLFRNLFGSLNSVGKDSALANDLGELLIAEMVYIQAAVSNQVGNSVSVVFYINDMSKLNKYIKDANFKHASTPKQRIYTALHDEALKFVVKNISLDEVDYRTFDVKLTKGKRALVLTHSPIDLLSHYGFDKLVLLESHTGKIKSKSQWDSKFANVDGVSIPFNGFTIQVFGDGGNYLSPMSIKYKRAVITIAKSDRWTAVTTLSKIKAGLNTIKDNDIREGLLEKFNNQSFSH